MNYKLWVLYLQLNLLILLLLKFVDQLLPIKFAYDDSNFPNQIVICKEMV